jgi:signal transduction histidine kinase
MFNSLRTRLSLLFIVLTVTPLVIVATMIALRGSATLQNLAVGFQEQLARQTATSLGAFFEQRQNEISVLTQVAGLDMLEPTAQKDVLLALLSQQPAYYEVSMVDASGDETIRLTRGEIITTDDLTSRADNPTFQHALQTREISFSPVHFSDAARDRLITMAVPIEDLYTGEISNVLISEIRFQNIEETVLRELNLSSGEDVYIVDENGVVVAHRNPSYVIRETIFDLPEANGRHAGLTQDDVVLAITPLEIQNLRLNIVAETTYANATALALNLTQLATVMTLLTLVVAGVFVAYAVTRVVTPIVNLSRATQAVQDGDLSVKAEVRGKDEIATLARNFNSMTAQLAQTLTGLRENVDALEKAKAEREALIKDLQTAKRIAEENSRLKSEFLSTMSHELRTPMNAIEGFTGIMLKRMGGVDYNEKTERFLQKVQSNSQRLLYLINDFLDLSRIESGRLELAHLPIKPAAMVERWKNELGILADNKGIAFEMSIDPALPETIYGDEEALSKIGINLLGNAFKFTSEGKVTLRLERRNEQMAIQVEDTGIGIPPHAREFIFDEFRQVDQSSKRKYGGTGLGLAIVQKLTRSMGGTVTVDSEVGKGSTFTVLIPIQAEPAQTNKEVA